MELGRLLVGFLLLVLGGVNVTRPELMVKYHVWNHKKILGAKLTPSARTYKVQQYIGIFYVILGLMILVAG